MAVVIKDFSYTNENHTTLYHNLNFKVNKGDKVNLIGANGTGKSTLLQLIANATLHSEIHVVGTVYYLPQINNTDIQNATIEHVLGIAPKRNALQNILNGSVAEEDFTLLNDDWNIEERIIETLHYWNLEAIDLARPMHSLSGGQQLLVYFATIMLQQPDLVLLDEPTNHIDQNSRLKLYHFIAQYKGAMLIVSHDIELLNNQNTTYELAHHKATRYNGNYDAYQQQKAILLQSLHLQVDHLAKSLKQHKVEQAKLKEKQAKAVKQNKKAEQKGGLPKIVINTLKNAAENSSAKASEIQENRFQKTQEELHNTRLRIEQLKPFSLHFNTTTLHNGKVLWQVQNVNYAYGQQANIWDRPLDFDIRSGERISIVGNNGKGKSTLLNLLMQKIVPTEGTLKTYTTRVAYLDQFYSLLKQAYTVLDQLKVYNTQELTDVELKNKLFQYGLPPHTWQNKVASLSGGECLRLAICCLNLSLSEIDVLLLDEPSNNLDIYGVESLYKAISTFNGTIVLISHNEKMHSIIKPSRTITF